MKTFVSLVADRSLVRLSLFGALVLGASVAGCASDSALEGEDDTEGGSAVGVAPPKPANSQPTLTCSTSSKPKTATITGFAAPLEYKNSDEIDYATHGWEDRIPVAQTNFGLEDNGRISIAAIDIRNVNGKPHYLYYTNKSARVLHENWSATKSIVIASAMNRIRTLSGGRVGALSNVVGKNTTKKLPDLVAEVQLNSDNNSATTFKDLGNRGGVTTFINGWLNLQRPERFDGPHGGAAKVTGPYTVRSLDGTASVQLPLMPYPADAQNTLSPLTLAEAVKRLGVNSRDPSLMPRRTDYASGALSAADVQKTPQGLTDDDLAVLFYGDSLAASTNSSKWRGMSNDGYGIESYALPAMGGKANADAKTGGRWRVFSKTGTGTSSARGVTEGVYMAHVCLPGFDGGREFAFLLHARVGAGETAKTIRARVTRAIFDRIVPGFRP